MTRAAVVVVAVFGCMVASCNKLDTKKAEALLLNERAPSDVAYLISTGVFPPQYGCGSQDAAASGLSPTAMAEKREAEFGPAARATLLTHDCVEGRLHVELTEEGLKRSAAWTRTGSAIDGVVHWSLVVGHREYIGVRSLTPSPTKSDFVDIAYTYRVTATPDGAILRKNGLKDPAVDVVAEDHVWAQRIGSTWYRGEDPSRGLGPNRHHIN